MHTVPPPLQRHYTLNGGVVRVIASADDMRWADQVAPLTSIDYGASGRDPEATVIVGELALSLDFIETATSTEAIYFVLPEGMSERLSKLPRAAARNLVTDLANHGTIFARSSVDLQALSELIPRMVARVEILRSETFSDALMAASVRSLNHGSVLVNVRQLWSQDQVGDNPVHFMVDRTADLKPENRVRQHWMPADDSHRDSSGFIEARRLAWYLLGASEAVQAHFIVVDRLDVVSALITSPSITAKTGFMLSSSELDRYATDPPRNLVGIFERLNERRGVVLCSRDEDIALLRKLGFPGKAVVFDPVSSDNCQKIIELGRRSLPLANLPKEQTVLVAGHDYKFLAELVDLLRDVPQVNLTFDQWITQAQHDVQKSEELLQDADVILCEFSSHNAIWYSWHKRPGQRLIVRFHGYELFQQWIHDINVDNVDKVVFVSEFYRRQVVDALGWPIERTAVVPNMIDAAELDGSKNLDARFHLGIAGIVPILKRPDRALDLLEKLLAHDDRYVLHFRGRYPWDYDWVWNQPGQRDAYDAVFERLASNPDLLSHVSFDPFGADMGQWFRRIGWMLSPSYRETFHLAPVEGQAGGAVPVVWDRDGAREVFDPEWVHTDTDRAADYILEHNQSDEQFQAVSTRSKDSAIRYDISTVGPQWVEILFGQPQEKPQISDRFDRDAMESRLKEDFSAALLDRLVLLLLNRDRDLRAAQELIDTYRNSPSVLSPSTLRAVEEAQTAEVYCTRSFIRPRRCTGSAYLPVHDSFMSVSVLLDCEEHTPSSRDNVNEGSPTCIFVAQGSQDPQCVAVIPDRPKQLDRVQIITDAVIRSARGVRPASLVVEQHDEAVWPVLIAARRLGIPAILSGTGDESSREPSMDEFDARVAYVGDMNASVVAEAIASYRQNTEDSEQVSLSNLTVGIVADEFTERTIAGRCAVIHIPRDKAYLSLVSNHLDALFIESAWSGRDGEWFHGVAFYKDEREEIERLIETAQHMKIPVIFWNKEDPVHFKSFAPTASLCDAVYTTDADRIPAYLQLGEGHGPKVVASMPFYAEPVLHNPLPGTWPENSTVSYAGTYYGARYAKRSAELDSILAAAAPHGLTIYDRQANLPDSPYHFPERFSEFIQGGLSYDEVLEAYKAHPVHINVNSVSDSPTMFSRRVVEIAASGSVVVSGKGHGLEQCLPVVPVSSDARALGVFMENCLTNTDAWRSSVWDQLRAVRRSYLADQALALMFRGIGLPVALVDETAWSAMVDRLDVTLATNLLEQTLRPTEVVAQSVDDDTRQVLLRHGIPVRDESSSAWSAHWTGCPASTWAEDLMHAARFAPADVARIGGREALEDDRGLLVWGGPYEEVVFERREASGDKTLVWLYSDETKRVGEDTND